jgi:hypothetical protein
MILELLDEAGVVTVAPSQISRLNFANLESAGI